MLALPLHQINPVGLLTHLLQTTPWAVLVLDAVYAHQQVVDFTFTWANPAAYALLELSPNSGQAMPSSYLQRFPTAHTIGLFDRLVEVLQTGESFHQPELAYTWDDVQGWFEVQVNRFESHLVVLLREVTERKEAEAAQRHQAQTLQRLNQELQRSNERLLEFSYVASHDLQEPLRKIRQFGNLLAEHYGLLLGEQGQEWLRRMQGATVRMSALIGDLLDYSRLSSPVDQFGPLDLNEVVEGVLSALDVAIAETGAVINVGQLGTVAGDATQLAQVFQNLVSNALKFVKPGQVPRLRIEGERLGVAHLPQDVRALATHGMYLAIRVSDEGIGFTPDQAERIFGAFQRLHGKDKYPGTGIGLAIVKKVVEQHGGYIRATGQPGHGATFHLYLPLE